MDCTDPKIVRKIKKWCIILLAVLFVADFLFFMLYDPYVHPHFEEYLTIDAYSFVFYPVFGFVACWLMVIGSKRLISQVLKRKDTYYDD